MKKISLDMSGVLGDISKQQALNEDFLKPFRGLMASIDQLRDTGQRRDLITPQMIERLAAPKSASIPLPLTNGKIPRSDDGFSLLANALRLCDLHGLIDAWRRASKSKPIGRFISESLERNSFERMLTDHAIYDSRLKISKRTAFHEIDGIKLDTEMETVKYYHARILNLINSGTDIAQLRFVDLNLTTDELRKYGLDPSPTEKRTPIAKQSPSGFTKALKRLVVDYFERVDGSAEPRNPNEDVPDAVKKRHCEDKIVELLGGFYSDNPNMRISKKNAKQALKSKFDIGKRGFDRIWKKFNVDRESKSGMIPIAEALFSIDLENFCRKNAAIYGLKN